MTITTMAHFKHPMDIENMTIGMLYSIFYFLFVVPFVKNPCKKCLVRPCCSERCQDKKDFDDTVGIGKLWEAKGLSLTVWTVLSLIVISCLIK